MERSSTYRPDIDGLRAVAVLLVVASHLHVPHLAGGYVGVDVFFVISGYLISSIIVPQIAGGTFSLAEFYERRVRRIVPALVVMLAATVPLAWHYLFPTEMVAYARSLLAAVFACSNTLLWSWHGYFDTANDLKPLLHTWSLGVEEQFYLAFPLAAMLAARVRGARAIRLTVVGVAVLSFVAACVVMRASPRTAFFSSALRAWELLLGSMLSQGYVRAPLSAAARNVCGVAGLAMIVAAAIVYSGSTVFPGLAALTPCVGAMLVIAAGERGSSVVARLLSLRPMVFVGLISYSLYLWHWPVIVFANLRHAGTCSAAACNEPMSGAMRCGLFALSLVLATLSWRFVEMPFRSGRLRPARRSLFAGSAFAVGAVAACALLLLRTQGVPARFTPDAVQAASHMDFDTFRPWRWNQCALALDAPSMAQYDQQRCLPFTPGAKHYLLLGDSHAAQLWPGLSATFPELQFGQANVAGCNLLPAQRKSADAICRQMAEFVYRDLLPSHRVDTLVVSALWYPNDLPAIAELVEFARGYGIDVVIVGPNVSYTAPLPRLLGRLEQAHAMGEVGRYADTSEAKLDAQMSDLARDVWRVSYVSFFADVCLRGVCPAYAAPGQPMLLDSNHLTPEGAGLLARAMRERRQLP